MGPRLMGASFDSPGLAIVLYRRERIQVVDDYEENPVGAFRGVAFAMLFSAAPAVTGFGGWMIWKILF